jgi:hypothetical protein
LKVLRALRIGVGIAAAIGTAAGCQPSPQQAFIRRLKAAGQNGEFRVDANRTIHVRRADGSEMWFDLQDQASHRFHMREGGMVKLMVRSPADAPAMFPPDVQAIIVPGGGLARCPEWLRPYPTGGARPDFTEIHIDRTFGSWRFQTPDDTVKVRQFFAAQLKSAGLAPVRGVAAQPAPDLPTVIDAGTRGGARFVQIRMGPGPGTGSHGEVVYEYAH